MTFDQSLLSVGTIVDFQVFARSNLAAVNILPVKMSTILMIFNKSFGENANLTFVVWVITELHPFRKTLWF